MPELLQHRRGPLDGGHHCRVGDGPRKGGRGGHQDALGSRRNRHRLQVRLSGRWRRVGVADGRTCDGVEKRGAVTHRAGQRMFVDQPFQPVPGAGGERRSAAAGFEPDQPAAGCRHSDRAGSVTARGGRHDAGGHRRRGPAAGTTGGDVRRPRVDRRSEQRGFGGAVVAPLRGVRLAEDHQAGVQIPFHDPRRLGGHVSAQGARPHRLRGARQRRTEIFEQEGHPGQRPRRSGAQRSGGVEVRGLLLPAGEQVGDDRVEVSAHVQTQKRGFQQFGRGDLARGRQGRLPDGVDIAEFHRIGEVHGSNDPARSNDRQLRTLVGSYGVPDTASGFSRCETPRQSRESCGARMPAW